MAFVRQQVDEDELVARMLLIEAQRVSLTLKDPKHLGKFMPGWSLWPDVEQMAQDRLAEVEAKRDLIGHIEGLILYATSPNYAHGGIEAWANRALTMLAQPYAGREGWREEWSA